ncbi:MAG: hypothetical protein LIO91_06205 [Bacteroidales bacterium]|nr:hypothetical protein [Bacteroidales bacterium]
MENEKQIWITPANEDYFRVEEAYAVLPEIDWTLGATPAVGDTVYIYISGPAGHVALQTEVTRIDVPRDEAIDDSAFMVGEQSKDDKPLTRLKLVAHAAHKGISFGALKLHGLTTTLQTTQRLPESCATFIEKHFSSPMLNPDRMTEVKDEYLRCFNEWWPNERYKLEFLADFKAKWDIEAEDFKAMFKDATAKHFNLLDSARYFPRAMVQDLCDVDAERVREMFRTLYDESKSLAERYDFFTQEAEALNALRSQPGNMTFQDKNSVSVFLWLRYPDKYYIYKSRILKSASEYLGYEGNADDSLEEGFRYQDILRDELVSDPNLLQVYKEQIAKDGLEDPGFHTLTIDFDYFLGRNYLSRNKQYWLFAPGHNADNWDRDFSLGEMSIGWDELGNLRQYKTKGALQKGMREAKMDVKSANQILNFSQGIREGDVVLARCGRGQIIGMGTVEGPYKFDESKEEFCNIHKVNWTHRCDIDTSQFDDFPTGTILQTVINATTDQYPRII